MKINIEKGIFVSPAQLMSLLKNPKCSKCHKKATWLSRFDEQLPLYCDDHYPYREEAEECKLVASNEV